MAEATRFMYTNYRGEYAVREVMPIEITYGATEWHPEPGWLLRAFDHERGEERQFALKDCDFSLQGHARNVGPDQQGRVWMHVEEGLALSKASMTRFIMFCVLSNVEIGTIWPFNRAYHGSLVCASVRLKPDQFEAFEKATGGKLRTPPKLNLN